ncbi:hypothetical protein ACD661_10910 [Legionella lytica]|uniref:Coiled coil protein n=1 Tax=Legionella lytica TaxID=96232 RepID=A0ABW8DBY4_9GAMM
MFKILAAINVEELKMGKNRSSSFFSTSSVKEAALRLIQFFKTEPQMSEINVFNQRLEAFQEQLTQAKTSEALFSIAHQMIELQNQIRIYRESKRVELDIPLNVAVENQLLQLCESEENSNVKILFAYTDIATQNLNDARQPLAINEMYFSLSEEKRIEAKKFIDSLIALQGAAQQMTTIYNELEKSLKNAQSMDEVNEIDERVDGLHHSLAGELPKLIDIPKDPQTVGAVMAVVNDNQRLLDILTAFKPQEVLFSNIMNARAKVISNSASSSPPGFSS